MKKIFFFFLFFFVVFGVAAEAQMATGFSLIDSSQVYNYGMTVQDTGNPGPAYRMEMSTNYSNPDPSITAYTMYAKDYGSIPQQPNIPPTITIQANSPLWTIAGQTNGGNCRIAIAADDGNGNGGVSQFNYVFPSSSWGTYTFQLAGISKISAADKQELMTLFGMKNISTTYPFKRLRVAFSFLSGETGTRVVFFDNITAVNGNGTTVVIDDGSGVSGVTLNAPVLQSPANSATNVGVNPVFLWSTVTNATSYNLQVSTTADFSSGVTAYPTSSTSQQVIGLDANTTYYWRADAANASATSAWSSVWSFSTGSTPPPQGLPGVPTLNSPSNGATNQPLNLTLIWNSSTNALTYEIQLLDHDGYVVYTTSTSGTSANPTGLAYGQTYFWRVDAHNSLGVSAWSDVWSFSTMTTPVTVGQPTLSFPPNNAAGISLNPDGSWNAASNATTYNIQVATNASFVSPVFSTTTSATNAIFLNLQYNTTYYWRVQGIGSNGATGPWSNTWDFTTQTITGVAVVGGVPDRFELAQNYPNPFNPSTTIRYSVPSTSPVTLKVYDVLGREVETLVHEEKSPGVYEINFDASKLASGLYIYRLVAGDFVSVKKMTLLK